MGLDINKCTLARIEEMALDSATFTPEHIITNSEIIILVSSVL